MWVRTLVGGRITTRALQEEGYSLAGTRQKEGYNEREDSAGKKKTTHQL